MQAACSASNWCGIGPRRRAVRCEALRFATWWQWASGCGRVVRCGPSSSVASWSSNRVAPNGYGSRVNVRHKGGVVASKGAGRAKNERHRGARPTVGGGVRAPYRLTIRLSEVQLETLIEAARGLGLDRRGLSKAARTFLLHGIGLNVLHEYEPRAVREALDRMPTWPNSPAFLDKRSGGALRSKATRQGRPVVTDSAQVGASRSK